MGSPINLKWTIGLGLVLFIVLGFGSFNDATDGLSQIGFPLVFVQYTGGKCIKCDSIEWFKPLYMMIDLLLAMVVSLVIFRFAKKLNLNRL